MTRNLFYIIILFLASCTLPEEKELKAGISVEEPTVIQTYDTNAAMNPPAIPLPITPRQKEPSGIYQGVLSMDHKIEQTVQFNDNHTFRLQERYLDKSKKDSMVLTEGTWSPSNGYIWLYKDQVVRARYKWVGDDLKYFNPESKKVYSMQPLQDIASNQTWKNKGNSGVEFYGIGNEPSWNIELDKKDSLKFHLREWEKPMQLKIHTFNQSGDSLIYNAGNDSTTINLVILPYFCNDGMSDYIYSHRVRVKYNNQVMTGCGMVYKKP